MKKILIILIIGLVWGACSEEKVWKYSLEEDYVYMPYDKNTMYGTTTPDTLLYNKSTVYVNATQQLDTFYFRINVAGLARKVDRKIAIEEYPIEIKYHEQAVAGVNYVAFDDPEMEKHLIVPADSLGVNIPIIVKYDPAIAGQYRQMAVVFKLVDSDDFKVMAINSDLQSGNTARACGYVSFTQRNY